jgi:hypothetical protein
MQGKWQHIMYNREETPPSGAWDTIAHKLEMGDAAGWATDTYLAEEIPPVGVWDTIAHKLEMGDASDWSTDIYLAEETPPPGIWDDICALLDNEAKSNWQTRLYNKEVVPPASVWAAITTVLDNNGARVIAMPATRSGQKSYARLAAAAAVIIAIAGTVVWFLAGRNTSTTVQPPVAVKKNTNTEVVRSAVAENADTATLPPTEVRPKQLLPVAMAKKQQKSPTTSVDDKAIPVLEYVKNNPISFLPEQPVLQNKRKLPGSNGQVSTDIALMETPASTYISMSGPDGQSIRVSSKFANLIGYLGDGPVKEERLDIIIRESALWKATFKQWREKMINHAGVISVDNFMDIVEMGKLLNEK